MTLVRIMYVAKRKAFIILGADNVGKTTLISTSIQNVRNKGGVTYYHHFSAPRNQTAREMYLDTADMLEDAILDRKPSHLYIDRAWPESAFYEDFRRKIIIPKEETLEIENYYNELFTRYGFRVSLILLYKPFKAIAQYHKNELAAEISKTQAHLTGEKLTLMDRELEHIAYYDFMRDYLENTCTLPYMILESYDIGFTLV